MALTRVTSGGIAPGVEIKFDQSNNPTAPAISFDTDTDTGIYSPAANTLAISTGGVERLKIGPNGEFTVGSQVNPVYIPVTDSLGAAGNDPTGKTIYVNTNHSLADDSLSNNGENLNRPFKTIERALIEAGRKSYVPGTGSSSGTVGADKFEYFTILVYPGQYEIDNRPGEFVGSFNSGSPADSYQGDYSSVLTAGALAAGDLYKFNSLNGGVIVPRGTSLVGLDLRKTVIRPKYVPDASSGTEAAIFSLTGGCYIWQLTFKDGVTQPYYNKSQQYSDANRSHHKLVGFKFASVGDLASYYRKVDHIDTNIPQSGSSVYELFQRIEENRIVGDSTNATTIDTVASASPYVFNCSMRSTWGMCGMHADGSQSTGFRSMVVAQYTGISLQRDDRAFYLNGTTTNNIVDADSRHSQALATYRTSWRHYHIKASNSSFIQIVSVFAVGFADHFLAESGGDLSITNSNSNFGNTSLRATGFQDQIFTQNNKGRITGIVPPKGIDPTKPENNINVTTGFVATQQTLGVSDPSTTSPNATNSNYKIIYFGQPITRNEIPEIRLNESGNDVRYLVLGNSYQYTLGKKSAEKLYLTLTSGSVTESYEEPIRFSSSSNDPFYNLHDNDERYGYGWAPIGGGTVTDSTQGYLYIKVTYAPNASSFAAGDNGLLKKLFTQSETVIPTTVTQVNQQTGQLEAVTQNITQYSYQYFYGINSQPFIKRLDDKRGISGGEDLLWRLEYTIPKTETNAKPPEARFVLYPFNASNGQGGFNKSIFIYSVETYQNYISGVQDGIYYLTVLSGDVADYTASVNGQTVADFSVSQNINYLYPTINQDTPIWNPVAATSKILVEGTGSNARSRDVATSYIDPSNPLVYPYTTPDFYSISREVINSFMSSFVPALPSEISTTTPYGGNTNNNTYGIEASEQDRKITLSTPLQISLKRSSVIRASGHTWEYMGYGPGNYSTSFPNLQTLVLDRYQIINSQGIEGEGGFVASTGTNSQGEFYIGNQLIKSGSDKTETLNVPRVKYSSETRLIDYNDISNQLTNSLITTTAAALAGSISRLQTQLSEQISGLSENFVTNNLTVRTSFSSLGNTILGDRITITNNNVSNNEALGFPTASTTGYGFVKKASDPVDYTEGDAYVTPADLEQWRIAKGIQTTTGSGSALRFIYIQPYRATTLVGSLGASATTITVQSTDGFDTQGVIEIEKIENNTLITEVIRYTGKTANTFTGCVRAYSLPGQSYKGVNATTAQTFSDGAGVYYADRYAWEEPFVQSPTSPVEYRPSRRVNSYTGSVQSYIDSNYTPNPQAAKDYGVNLQTLQPVKRFLPFSTIAQAAEWANKNGFGAADVLYCVMKPGYYQVGGIWNSYVYMGGGISPSGSNVGKYSGNDGVYNKSVFLFRTLSYGVGHPTYYYVSLGITGSMTFNKGGSIENCYVLSTDETYRREGIPDGTFQDPSARGLARSAPLGDGFKTWFKQALLNYKTSYESSVAATLQTAINAGDAVPFNITINRSFWFDPAAEGQGTGGIKIGNEVMDYTTQSFTSSTVTIQIIRRAVEGTTAASHSTGANIYRYMWRAGSGGDQGYQSNGNKWVQYYNLNGPSPFLNGSPWLYVVDGQLRFFNTTVGAYYPYPVASVGIGGGDSPSGIFMQNASLTVIGFRLRGNEKWDLSDFMKNYPSPVIGAEYDFMTLRGDCRVDSMSYGYQNYSTTLQGENYYNYRPTFNYTSGFFLESIVDQNGNFIEYHDGCHRGNLTSDITTTQQTITGNAALAAWPQSGKAMINDLELISYTSINDNGNNTYTLQGVTRNIGWHNGTTPGAGGRLSGTAGEGGPFKSGSTLTIASSLSLDYYNPSETRWLWPLSGLEGGYTDAADWAKLGPHYIHFFDIWRGCTLDFPGQYGIWSQYGISNPNGFIGRFGTPAAWRNSQRTASWRFKRDGLRLAWSSQYHDNLFKVGGPAGASAPPYPSIPSTSLTSSIGAGDTTIYVSRDVTGLWSNSLNFAGGVIKIDDELIYVGGVSDDAGNNRVAYTSCTRGWNRTVRASHSSGVGIGFPGGAISGGRTYIVNPALNITQIYFTQGIDLVDNIQSNASFYL